MLKAVTTKDLDLYLMNRKKVIDQIKLFDEEMKVQPTPKPTVTCAWCDGTTLNKAWHSDLR